MEVPQMIDETNNMSRHGTAGELLHASEIRYRRLFESAREGILILDAVNQKITDANPFMVELLGYSRNDFLGKELWEIGLFKDKDQSETAFRELQAAGYLRYENLPLQTKTGERREVEFISNVYEEGIRQVIQCHIRDITERHRAEIELSEQAALLANTQRIGCMGNWSLDLRSGRTIWSDATCNLFGIAPT